MVLNDFRLAKYRKTVGWEGEGYTATLMYKGKLVAEYEDYADGMMAQVLMSKDNWGKKPLLETMQAIHAAQGMKFLVADNPDSCAEHMCQILDEGRDMDSVYRKLAKKHPDGYIGLYLTGCTWTATPYEVGTQELRQLYAVPYAASSGSGNKLLKESIRESHEKGDFQTLAAYFLLEPGTPTPLVLTTDAYIQAFAKGKSLQQALESNGPTMGMEHTLG